MPSRLIGQALAGRCIRRPKDRLAAGRRATTVTAFRRNDGKFLWARCEPYSVSHFRRFCEQISLLVTSAAPYKSKSDEDCSTKKFQPSRRYGIESSFRKD